jgi:hypothetical protein
MSESSLSSAPNSLLNSPPPPSELDLPPLPPTPFVQPEGLESFLSQPTIRNRNHKPPKLPESTSELFSAGLLSRTILDTNPPTFQVRCKQPGCNYAPKPQLLSFRQTSNYWTHYLYSHPVIASLYKSGTNSEASSSKAYSHTSDIARLFIPRISKPITNTNTTTNNHTYRALLLDFVVSNNLSLRIVDSLSMKRLINFCNPSIDTISTTTLTRDLDKTFLTAQNTLKVELQDHVKGGGRISITTDAWSARNYKEFIAITGHWIDKSWKQRSQLLDIIYLEVSSIVLILKLFTNI